MKDIRVSIITVCYNSESTITRTIDSVLNQSYKNIEYIIVDGKSTDSTLAIIAKYKDKFGDRLKVISEHDNGIYDAMNKGIAIASGALIGILNSDDYYEKDAIEAAVNAAGDCNMKVVYGLMRTIKDGLEDRVYMLSHNFLDNRMICHPASFVTKDIYDTIGVFNSKYKSVGDYDFMLRVYQSKKATFVPVYKVFTNFAEDGMSSSLEGYLENFKYMYDQGKVSSLAYIAVRLYEPIKRFFVKKLF